MRLQQIKWQPQNKTVDRSQLLFDFTQQWFTLMRALQPQGHYLYTMYLSGADMRWQGTDPDQILESLVDWDTRKMTPLELKCWRAENGL